MKKRLFVLLMIPLSAMGQLLQIGSTIDGLNPGDNAYRVALNTDGTIMAVGGNGYDNGTTVDVGHVRIFQLENNVWIPIGNDIVGTQEASFSGTSVSLSDDGMTVAIGTQLYSSSTNDSAGKVEVYSYDGVEWQQLGQDIIGENFQGQLGRSVSLSADGRIMAVGIPGFNQAQGKVVVYSYNQTEWIPIENEIVGDIGLNFFGIYVNLNNDGSVVSVSAASQIGDAFTRVFELDTNNGWVQKGNDIISGSSSLVGYSGDINGDGNRIAVGTTQVGSNGSAQVFEFDGAIWQPLGQEIVGENSNDDLGFHITLDDSGTILGIGIVGFDAAEENIGRSSVYRLNEQNWVLLESVDGLEANDRNGSYVFLSRDASTIAIAGIGGNGSGNIRAYNTQELLNILEFSHSTRAIIYPNPTHDIISISSIDPIQTVTLFDTLGRKLEEFYGEDAFELEISVMEYSGTTFFLHIKTQGNLQIHRFIKN